MEAAFLINNCSSSLPVFICIYITIYLFGYFIIFKNWKGNHRPEASSCLISLAHGTPAVILATQSLLQHHHHQIQNNNNTQLGFFAIFGTQNTKSQNRVLEYSIAYFSIDLLHYMIFTPTDIPFIAHHLATLYVFITCRYIVAHGALGLLLLLVLAEVSSPCQNTWTLARFRKGDVVSAAKLYELLSPPFYGFYSFLRSILAPFFVYKMGVFYASGGADEVIPKWVWVSWMVVIVAAIFFSILWVLHLWVDLCSSKGKKVEKKSS